MAQIVQYIHISGQGRMGLFSKEFVIFKTIFPQQKKKKSLSFSIDKNATAKKFPKTLVLLRPPIETGQKKTV